MTGSQAYQARKARIERRVLDQVRECGGFSVFWATQSMEVARAVDRLAKQGRIKYGRASAFPWCRCRIGTPAKNS